MSSFILEKWYADAVTTQGTAVIIYNAALRWKALSLSYHGYILRQHSGQLTETNSFSNSGGVNHDERLLTISTGSISGEWRLLDAGFTRQLLQTDNGLIDWQCCFPKAKVNLRINSDHVEAIGYAEKIKLTIPPWKIPIRELYWGRYLSETNTVIWIRWIGPVPQTLIWLNGKLYQEGEISKSMVKAGEISLRMESHQTMKKGTIQSTVFRNFPLLAALFPGTILALQENKWKSEGELSIGNVIACKGNVIHEHVIW